MKVLVDTSVWSLALRRLPDQLSPGQMRLVQQLRELINEHRVVMIGPIRQELLSGIRDGALFDRVRDWMRAFPDERLSESDYEAAARMGNRCRAAGLACASIDLLICAVSVRHPAAILTTDQDFARYAELLPLKLVAPA